MFAGIIKDEEGRGSGEGGSAAASTEVDARLSKASGGSWGMAALGWGRDIGS